MHGRTLLVAAVVVLAGCSALGGGGATTSQATTATVTGAPTILETVTNDSATTAARSAAVDAAADGLYGVSNYTSVAVPYTGNGTEQVETTLLANNDTGIYVRVAVPVAYEYDCGDRSGSAQERAVSVYRVAPDGRLALHSGSDGPICG